MACPAGSDGSLATFGTTYLPLENLGATEPFASFVANTVAYGKTTIACCASEKPWKPNLAPDFHSSSETANSTARVGKS
jgi:hypothetical protein